MTKKKFTIGIAFTFLGLIILAVGYESIRNVTRGLFQKLHSMIPLANQLSFDWFMVILIIIIISGAFAGLYKLKLIVD